MTTDMAHSMKGKNEEEWTNQKIDVQGQLSQSSVVNPQTFQRKSVELFLIYIEVESWALCVT